MNKNISSENHISRKNELYTVIRTTPNIKMAALSVLVHVGSRHEPNNIFGISHLLEHMVFKGTKNRTQKEIAYTIENIGGKMNAYTGKEYTVYHVALLPEYIQTGINIIGDIVMNPLLNTGLELEKGVVVEEIYQTLNTPCDLVYDYAYSSVFAKDPMGHSIAGTKESVMAMTVNDLQSYHSQYYCKNNIFVSVVGNVQADHVEQMLQTTFGAMPKQLIQPSPLTQYQCHGCGIINDNINQQYVIISYPCGIMDERQEMTMQLFSYIIGRGFSSRLFQEVREKRGLVYDIHVGVSQYTDCGLFYVYICSSTEKVKEAIIVTKDILSNSIGSIIEEELMRAKAQIKTSLANMFDSAISMCDSMVHSMAFLGHPLEVTEKIMILETITLSDIERLILQILKTQPSLATVGPLDNTDLYCLI